MKSVTPFQSSCIWRELRRGFRGQAGQQVCRLCQCMMDPASLRGVNHFTLVEQTSKIYGPSVYFRRFISGSDQSPGESNQSPASGSNSSRTFATE